MELVEVLEHPLVGFVGIATQRTGGPGQLLIRVARAATHVRPQSVKSLSGIMKQLLDAGDTPL
jgi:hypothetical protein